MNFYDRLLFSCLLIGEQSIDDNFRRGFIFSQILFNAQDGKMESQWLKKTEMLYCPEVITWENTQ